MEWLTGTEDLSIDPVPRGWDPLIDCGSTTNVEDSSFGPEPPEWVLSIGWHASICREDAVGVRRRLLLSLYRAEVTAAASATTPCLREHSQILKIQLSHHQWDGSRQLVFVQVQFLKMYQLTDLVGDGSRQLVAR